MPPAHESKLHRALRGTHAEWALAFVATIESWFLPILIEPFMVLPILARPQKWFRITTIVTVFSVVGGVLGYLTGMFFFDMVGQRLIELYNVESYVASTTSAFNENVFWVIFAGAFSPLPYKVFTLIGGFLHVDFAMFLIASLAGRGLRFYAVGFVLGRFGEHALPLFHRHAQSVVMIIAVSLVLYALYIFL